MNTKAVMTPGWAWSFVLWLFTGVILARWFGAFSYGSATSWMMYIVGWLLFTASFLWRLRYISNNTRDDEDGTTFRGMTVFGVVLSLFWPLFILVGPLWLYLDLTGKLDDEVHSLERTAR